MASSNPLAPFPSSWGCLDVIGDSLRMPPGHRGCPQKGEMDNCPHPFTVEFFLLRKHLHLGLCLQRKKILFMNYQGVNVPCALTPTPRHCWHRGFAETTDPGPDAHWERNPFSWRLYSGPKVHHSRVDLATAVRNSDTRNPCVPLAFMADFHIFPPVLISIKKFQVAQQTEGQSIVNLMGRFIWAWDFFVNPSPLICKIVRKR